jgi:hypothetical protein
MKRSAVFLLCVTVAMPGKAPQLETCFHALALLTSLASRRRHQQRLCSVATQLEYGAISWCSRHLSDLRFNLKHNLDTELFVTEAVARPATWDCRPPL